MFDYIIENGSTNLIINLTKLVSYFREYKIDYRRTVIDLLDIGASFRAVMEFEQLHDQYYLDGGAK